MEISGFEMIAFCQLLQIIEVGPSDPEGLSIGTPPDIYFPGEQKLFSPNFGGKKLDILHDECLKISDNPDHNLIFAFLSMRKEKLFRDITPFRFDVSGIMAV